MLRSRHAPPATRRHPQSAANAGTFAPWPSLSPRKTVVMPPTRWGAAALASEPRGEAGLCGCCGSESACGAGVSARNAVVGGANRRKAWLTLFSTSGLQMSSSLSARWNQHSRALPSFGRCKAILPFASFAFVHYDLRPCN